MSLMQDASPPLLRPARPGRDPSANEAMSRRRVILGGLAAGAALLGGGYGVQHFILAKPIPDDDDDDVLTRVRVADGPARHLVPAVEPIVRVRIARARDPRDATLIDLLGGPGWISVAAEHADGPGAAYVLRAPLRLARTGDGWRLQDDAGYTPAVDPDATLRLRPLGGDRAGLRVDETPYPGTVAVHPRTDIAGAAFDVVNHTALEAYLPGVLARELFNHWRPEAFAAQAVAARSYAASEIQHFANRRHYDVTNTQASQAYIGEVELPVAREAVEATRGVCLQSGPWLTPGYYSACCGGRANRAIDGIGPNPVNDLPTLEGRPGDDVCLDAPPARWQVRRTATSFGARIAAYGAQRDEELRDFDALAAITVADANHHGRPVRYELRDVRGRSATIDAGRLRAAANYATRRLARPKDPFRSGYLDTALDITVTRGVLDVDGRGYGHGVGLCQHGAQQLARNGLHWADILEWYYPGIELSPPYAARS